MNEGTEILCGRCGQTFRLAASRSDIESGAVKLEHEGCPALQAGTSASQGQAPAAPAVDVPLSLDDAEFAEVPTEDFPGLRQDYCPGRIIIAGRYRFIVPPMLMAEWRRAVTDRLFDKLAAIEDKGITPEQADEYVGTMRELVLRVLRRNYPNIQAADIENTFDLASATQVLAAAVTAHLPRPQRRGRGG